MLFAFEFQLTVDKLTGPAKEAAEAVGKLNARMLAAVKAIERLDPLLDRIAPRLQKMAGSLRGVGHADSGLGRVVKHFEGIERAQRGAARGTNLAKIADDWQKMAGKAERAEQMATKAAEREAAKRIGIRERESKSADRMWTRIAFAAQKQQDRAQEAARHKSYFGGFKSASGLLGSRAEAKISGMATGAADALLAAPGRLLSGTMGALGSVLEGSASLAYNFGKAAIAAQSMREDSVEALAKVYKSAEAGNRLFDVARSAAKQTKFDTQPVVNTFTTLATGGFDAAAAEKMFWTVADIESKRAGKGEIFTNAINKIKGGGQTAGFGAFQSAAAAGPGLTLALPELGKQLGMAKAPTRLEAMKMFRQGKISSNTALSVLVNSTNQLLNPGGKAGDFAKSLGDKTWSGIISNIKNGLGDVLNMKLPDDHPINKFKKVLQAIGSSGGLFDESSERGRKFSKLVSDFAEDVFSLVGIDASTTGGALDKMLQVGKKLEEAFRSAVNYINTDVKPAIAAALSDNSFDDNLTLLSAKIASIIAKGVVVGIGEGINQAIKGTANGIENSIAGPGSMLGRAQNWLNKRNVPILGNPSGAPLSYLQPAGSGSKGDISPLPKLARGGIVDRPTVALVGEAGPEAVVPLSGRGGGVGGFTINGGLSVYVTTSGSGGASMGQEIGIALMQFLRTQVRNPSALPGG